MFFDRPAVAIFRKQNERDRIGQETTDNAQDHPAHEERPGIGHHLMIDPREGQVAPIEGRKLMYAQQCRSGPIGSPENGDEGPRVVEKRAGQQGDQIQSERPGAETHHQHVETVRRRKSDDDADCEGQGGAVWRFAKMKNLAEKRPNVCHGRSVPGARGMV